MLRHRVFILVTLAVTLAAGCATTGSSIVDRNQSGRLPQGSSYADVPEADVPEILPQTYFAAANLFEKQGLYNKAILQYQHAIGAKHDFVQAYQRLGRVLSKVNKHEEAVLMLRKAVHLDPDNPVLHNNLGFELGFLKRWAEAEQSLRTALKLDPHFTRAQVNLAMIYGQQGRFDESFAKFKRVLPEEDAYYNIGLLYKLHNRHAEAYRAFQQILRINPSFAAAIHQIESMEQEFDTTLWNQPAVASTTPAWHGPDRDSLNLQPAITKPMDITGRTNPKLSQNDGSGTAQGNGTMAATVMRSGPPVPMDRSRIAFIAKMSAMQKRLDWTQEETRCLEALKNDLEMTSECAAALEAAIRSNAVDAQGNPLEEKFMFQLQQLKRNLADPIGVVKEKEQKNKNSGKN